MASSPSTSPGPPQGPNSAFRQLRGHLSPGEFAAAVRRSAQEIGERVCCDARYIGRVESGEIRCPNYAYERVFLHMFPGRTLADMGFAPRESVRGRAARTRGAKGRPRRPSGTVHHESEFHEHSQSDEESDVLRRAFMTGGPAALAAVSLSGITSPASAASAPNRLVPSAPAAAAGAPGPSAAAPWTAWPQAAPTVPPQAGLVAAAHGPGRVGEPEVVAVERAVRQIRLLDDRHGADDLYPHACDSLRAAYELLDTGARRASISDRLHAGAGELALSVGWLAHDSRRFDDARSHYSEALATARLAADPALEAHAFCNTAFLARDAGRPREAVRAAQAGVRAARPLGSARLLSLLALREAGGWAAMGDRRGSVEALGRARTLFGRGPHDADPVWMTFFGEAELEGLEAQCWSALGDWDAAARHARRAVALQQPHFLRNRALFTAELAGDLAARGRPEEAAAIAAEALALLGDVPPGTGTGTGTGTGARSAAATAPVRSTRIRAMLTTAVRRLEPYRAEPAVAALLDRRSGTPR